MGLLLLGAALQQHMRSLTASLSCRLFFGDLGTYGFCVLECKSLPCTTLTSLFDPFPVLPTQFAP